MSERRLKTMAGEIRTALLEDLERRGRQEVALARLQRRGVLEAQLLRELSSEPCIELVNGLSRHMGVPEHALRAAMVVALVAFRQREAEARAAAQGTGAQG